MYGAWKQNVGQNQWIEKSKILSVAYKWLDEIVIEYRKS